MGAGLATNWKAFPIAMREDTLEACAYSFEDPYTLYGASDVVFSWQVSDSPYGTFEEVAQGASFVVAEDFVGRYLKVVLQRRTAFLAAAPVKLNQEKSCRKAWRRFTE